MPVEQKRRHKVAGNVRLLHMVKNKATRKWPLLFMRMQSSDYFPHGNLPAKNRKIVSAAGSVAYFVLASAHFT